MDLRERFWARVDVGESDACWEWTLGRSPRGYGKIKIAGCHLRAHRVAYELAIGPIPDGLWVLHRCDNPPCCNPAHLFLGTAADNAADMVAKGRAKGAPRGLLNGSYTRPDRRPRGERNGQAKLTAEAVAAMRREYGAGDVTQQVLSERYGVARSMVSRIVNRQRWAES